jgi:hypothetical protein
MAFRAKINDIGMKTQPCLIYFSLAFAHDFIAIPPCLIYFSPAFALDFIATNVGEIGLYVWIGITNICSQVLIPPPSNWVEALFSVDACIAFDSLPNNGYRKVSYSTLYLQIMNAVEWRAGPSTSNHPTQPTPFDPLNRLDGLILAPRDCDIVDDDSRSESSEIFFCIVSQCNFILFLLIPPYSYPLCYLLCVIDYRLQTPLSEIVLSS